MPCSTTIFANFLPAPKLSKFKTARLELDIAGQGETEDEA